MIRLRYTALLLALAAGCAGAPTTVSGPVTQSFPGFDTGIYPGDGAMTAWRRPSSPYHWVGYYLPAPCRRDASWTGRRQTLTAMGWGLAVLYVGQQTWEGVAERAPAPVDTGRAGADTLRAQGAAQRSIVCSRTLLSAAQGRSEADDAITRAEAEGFARGTHIFLDVERMTAIPQSMREYYSAWVTRVLADGRYRPAIYAHQRNAAEIYADVKKSFELAGITDEPRFWIASGRDFHESKPPTAVGHAFAGVWQGVLDAARTVANITLPVDVNVAAWPSPSETGTAVE